MGINLLIVDDQTRITSVYTPLEDDYDEIDHVYNAHDEDEYWTVFNRHRESIDVVVMDLMLDTRIPITLRGEAPVRFSGFTLIEQTLKQYPKTKIAVLTQYHHDTTILSAYRLGALCFLPKHQHGLASFVATMVEVAAGQVVIPSGLPLSVRNKVMALRHDKLKHLDDEEIAIIDMILNGYNTEDVREAINSTSVFSTQNKISRIFKKLNCPNRQAMKRLALDAGMKRFLDQ